MAIQAMNNVLELMQSVATQAANVQKSSPLRIDGGSVSQPDFANVLIDAVRHVNDVQVNAKTQGEKFMMGDSDVSLNDVMVGMQKSSLMLNLGVQVRNKIVSAYQDIMNMPV